MIHTWHETPNPLKKEAVVIHNWKWLQKLFLDYVEAHDWRESSGTYHWSTALYDGLYCQGPRCTDAPWWPCQASPGTATHSPCPRTPFQLSPGPSVPAKLCCTCVCLQLCPSQASAWPWILLIPSPWTDILAWLWTCLTTTDLLDSRCTMPEYLEQVS